MVSDDALICRQCNDENSHVKLRTFYTMWSNEIWNSNKKTENTYNGPMLQSTHVFYFVSLLSSMLLFMCELNIFIVSSFKCALFSCASGTHVLMLAACMYTYKTRSHKYLNTHEHTCTIHKTISDDRALFCHAIYTPPSSHTHTHTHSVGSSISAILTQTPARFSRVSTGVWIARTYIFSRFVSSSICLSPFPFECEFCSFVLNKWLI